MCKLRIEVLRDRLIYLHSLFIKHKATNSEYAELEWLHEEIKKEEGN